MGQELPEDYESPECNPVSLRDGERPDVSTHTQANLAALREHERRGEAEEGTFENAAERHGLDPEEARDLLSDPTPGELDALDDGDRVELVLDDGRKVVGTVEDPRHPNLGGYSGNGQYSRYFADEDGRRFSLVAYHEDKNDERRRDETYYVQRTKIPGKIHGSVEVEKHRVRVAVLGGDHGA